MRQDLVRELERVFQEVSDTDREIIHWIKSLDLNTAKGFVQKELAQPSNIFFELAGENGVTNPTSNDALDVMAALINADYYNQMKMCIGRKNMDKTLEELLEVHGRRAKVLAVLLMGE